MDRAISHIDLDTFFVSCVRLENPKLNNIPLIVGGGSDRGVVASCSYEARKFGVRSAMPVRMALRLCPEAKVVKGDMEFFTKKSNEVTDVIRETAPVVEKASIDEFYLDLTGMDRFFGCYHWSTELAERITRNTGLPISFALSVNKTVSKIGTGEAKPTGKLEIPKGNVQNFLNPLSVRKIPMVGEKTSDMLSRIGIRQIKTLAEMPREMIGKILGENGLEIWRRANGIDDAPVVPFSERKSLSTEHTYSQDTIDIPEIKALLSSMVEKLAFQLRDEGWLASIVTVKVRYSNFDTETKQARVQYTSSDHALCAKTHELFDSLYQCL